MKSFGRDIPMCFFAGSVWDLEKKREQSLSKPPMRNLKTGDVAAGWEHGFFGGWGPGLVVDPGSGCLGALITHSTVSGLEPRYRDLGHELGRYSAKYWSDSYYNCKGLQVVS